MRALVNDLVKMVMAGKSPESIALLAREEQLEDPIRWFNPDFHADLDSDSYWKLLDAVNALPKIENKTKANTTDKRGIVVPADTTEGTIANKPCEICGRNGHWNPGAAQVLCSRHWDEY